MGGSKNNIGRAFWTAVRFILTVMSLSAIGYVALALLYSTPEEKRLQEENTSFAELYPSMSARIETLGDDIDKLARKDESIYSDIFHAAPPQRDPVSSMDIFFGSDSIPDARLVFYTAGKADALVREAAVVDSLFERIAAALASKPSVMPPMTLPLDSLNYTQVGAGIGTKTNPFYTTEASHNGVDLIVGQGTPVYAAADGIVNKVSKSRRGEGNTVAIRHNGGYVTRYSHLQEIDVQQGQSVRKGRVIGTVGMSGNSYAPHLHYEVRRDSLVLDPLSYIFASVTPEEYSNMVYMAAHTRQSMD